MVLKGCILLPETLLEIIRENRKKLLGHPLRYLVCRLPIYHEPQRDSLARKEQKRKIENLEAEIGKIKTSGGAGDEVTQVDGIRLVVMETHGTLKDMTKMLKELTRMNQILALAVLGSKEGGEKPMVACTENSPASLKYNAVDILKSISPMIKGGGGGRPTLLKAEEVTRGSRTSS